MNGTLNTTNVQDKDAAYKEDTIIELRNIHKTYLLGIEGVAALRGVSLKINRGEWVVIYGTSGGGKTSLLNIIGTIDKPTKGDLRICNTIINSKTKDKTMASLRLNNLGFVFQSFNLLSSLTAQENVELPMTLKGILNPSQRKKHAIESLERVGLNHRLNHFPSQLSGGEQQRVTIARAIANSPELLLLDEPTGDLDTFNTHKIIDLLFKLNRDENMTMVMVTHDVYLKNFANRVVYMRDGKIAGIENITETRRQSAYRELKDKIQKHQEVRPTLTVIPSVINIPSIPPHSTVIDISDNVYNSPIDVSHSNNSNTSSPVRDTQVAMVLPDSSVAPELMKRGVWTKTEFRVPEDYDTFTGKAPLPAIPLPVATIPPLYLRPGSRTQSKLDLTSLSHDKNPSRIQSRTQSKRDLADLLRGKSHDVLNIHDNDHNLKSSQSTSFLNKKANSCIIRSTSMNDNIS